MATTRTMPSWSDESGGVAVITALTLPVLALTAMAAVEYSSLTGRRAQIQSAADSAVLAAAGELRLANADDARVISVAKAAMRAAMAAKARDGATATVEAYVLDGRSRVEVRVTEAVPSVMGGLLNRPTSGLEVGSAARVSGNTRICMVGLDPSQAGTVSLTMSAQLTAERCSVFSNSTSPRGLSAAMNAVVRAEKICSSGGYEGRKGSNFTPEPITDCPPVADPLAGRPPPFVGGCDYENRQVPAGQHTLRPGVYCGGLRVLNGAKVTLTSGTYVMDGGPLIVANASFVGDNVGFYFRGPGAILNFMATSTISLSAPKTGDMAGILFFEDRSAPAMRRFSISSNNARRLLGTIYLPKGSLAIDANSPVADQSAYTVVVARQVELSAGPNLVLNADYGGTDVPVPKGVGPVGASISLAQ